MMSRELSPMAEEMRDAVLRVPGITIADIDRMIAVLERCDALMAEAIKECIRDGIRQGFNQVFTFGFVAGLATATFVASLGMMLS